MSKSNPSDIKVAVPTPGAFAGLKSLNLQVFVMIAAIIVIMLFFTWMTDGSYLSARNVSNLLRQTAITGILAVGMVFVIISAEIDLSVGSMMGLLGGVAAIFDVWLGWPLPLTIAVTLVLGLLLGAWNGWWVAYRKVPSFIVTLAGMLAFRGILIGITNGTTVSPTSASMSQIGQSYLSDGVGFTIGVVGLMAFVAWQWRGRMRRQALGLTSPASTSVVGRQALTAVIVLCHLAVKRLSRCPNARSAAGAVAVRWDVYGHTYRIRSPYLCHRRQSGSRAFIWYQRRTHQTRRLCHQRPDGGHRGADPQFATGGGLPVCG